MNRIISALLVVLVLSSSVSALANEDNNVSALVEFESYMMESISSQINTAADLTITANNRAILAALLSLEFSMQEPDFTIDYSLPIYVCKQENIAAVAIGGEDDYALIIYESKPLSTCYGILYGNNPAMVKAALEISNEYVWEVGLNEYNQKLTALMGQL